MKKNKKTLRFIGGALFTFIFIVFAIVSCRVAVHSSDLENYEDTHTNRVYGYDRDRYLINHGRFEETSGYLSPEQAALQAQAEEAPLAPEEEPSGIIDPVWTPQPAVQEEVQIDPDSPAGRAAALGLPAPPEIDINSWQYMLVNHYHPLDQSYEPEQKAYLNMTGDDTDVRTDYDPNRQVVDYRIAQSLVDFAQGCRAAGLSVYLSSGYRSYSEQYNSYQNKISQYNSEVARFIVAEPGTSEHQTGMCCDITDYYRNPKDKSIENTDTYKWLYAHCAEYGFILRYPADKSGDENDLAGTCPGSVTEVMYEPWHFRYVGTEAAQYIMQNKLCLEEFWELYAPGTTPAEKFI